MYKKNTKKIKPSKRKQRHCCGNIKAFYIIDKKKKIKIAQVLFNYCKIKTNNNNKQKRIYKQKSDNNKKLNQNH